MRQTADAALEPWRKVSKSSRWMSQRMNHFISIKKASFGSKTSVRMNDEKKRLM